MFSAGRPGGSQAMKRPMASSEAPRGVIDPQEGSRDCRLAFSARHTRAHSPCANRVGGLFDPPVRRFRSGLAKLLPTGQSLLLAQKRLKFRNGW